MESISNSNFGLLIAYVLPGYVVIWGLSGFWPITQGCMGGPGLCDPVPSLIGFLNMTVAAVAAGMVVSTTRFILIDTAHHLTGLKRPVWNGAILQANIAAMNTLIEQHYRYYQFHANMLVAGLVVLAGQLYQNSFGIGLVEVTLIALTVIFWVGSRDNLKKYYSNLHAIFNPLHEKESSMTNGMHHDHEEKKTKTKNGQSKSQSLQPKAKGKADTTESVQKKANAQG